ncbi:hypothetical protein ACTS9C_03190 [Empedobacter brevis]
MYTSSNRVSSSKRNNKPPDDHFDQKGNFLYKDNKTTNNIIIHPMLWDGTISKAPWTFIELKDYNFNSDSDFMMLSQIAYYYSSFAGVDATKLYNGNFSVGAFEVTRNEGGRTYGINKSYNDGKFWGITSDGSDALMHANPNSKMITINIFNGKINSLLNNRYNFISVLGHEGGPDGHLSKPNTHHVEIYRSQMNNKIFKYTTPEFKDHVIKNYKIYGGNTIADFLSTSIGNNVDIFMNRDRSYMSTSNKKVTASSALNTNFTTPELYNSGWIKSNSGITKEIKNIQINQNGVKVVK